MAAFEEGGLVDWRCAGQRDVVSDDLLTPVDQLLTLVDQLLTQQSSIARNSHLFGEDP